jgi:hypothetical protein
VVWRGLLKVSNAISARERKILYNNQSPAATQGSSVSDEGFQSMSSSHSSSRSFTTVTDSMSDLIITTGYETMHPESIALRSTTNAQIREDDDVAAS